MIKINENYLNLEQNYLFPAIAKKVKEYREKHPSADIISLGIGDVTRPLPRACVEALHKASDEMACEKTFRGYGPEQGYSFLIEDIIKNDYEAFGIELSPQEVFVSDGAKCDVGNIQEIFSTDITVAVADPVYPVYLDTNIMAGRKVLKLPCLAENGFAPKIPDFKADLIYLCSPNNPTGAVLNKEQLKEWVDYAKKNGSVIIFDSAYKEYIRQADLPRSILPEMFPSSATGTATRNSFLSSVRNGGARSGARNWNAGGVKAERNLSGRTLRGMSPIRLRMQSAELPAVSTRRPARCPHLGATPFLRLSPR